MSTAESDCARRPVRPRERGAALLAVLVLVAIIGALAAAALDRLRLSTALAANSVALDQARAFSVGVESLVQLRIDDLLAMRSDVTTLEGGWNGSSRTIPLPGGGVAEATIRDGGNCFNVNSVGNGDPQTGLVQQVAGVTQFENLMRLLQVPEGSLRQIAAAAGDWVDSDFDASPGGAEDAFYGAGEAAYRTGNTLFADVSELRGLAGMTPEIFALMRPWLCALPATDLSPINLNTLYPDQALLLAMLAPQQVGLDTARKVIEQRPASGWSSLVEFYRSPALSHAVFPLNVQFQPQVRTRWFALQVRVDLGEAAVEQRALIDARIAPSRVAIRQWE